MSNPVAALAVQRIFSEAPQWQALMRQEADKVLDVYIDLKSPHAYLAVRPSLEVTRDFRVRVNFVPYTLSYEALSLTTSVEPDMQRRPASAAADRKARMYYATARQYAALQGLPLRSPHRLLDSELAHRCFLFAKQQGLEVRFAMSVYLQGWSTGWRDYELESLKVLRGTLAEVGANIDGVEDFVANGGAGQQELVQANDRANATGCVGVPHYVFDDVSTGRVVGLFGREHLALIRGKFAAAGLARNTNAQAEFSHAWSGPQNSVATDGV